MGNSTSFASRKIFLEFCPSYPLFFEVPPRKFSGANFGINFRERTLGFFLPNFFGGAIACQYRVDIRLSVQCRRLVFFGGGFGFPLPPSRSALLPPSSSSSSASSGAGPGFPPLGWAALAPTQVSGVPDSRIFTQELARAPLPLSSFLPPSCLGRLLLLSSFFSRSLSLSLSLLRQTL